MANTCSKGSSDQGDQTLKLVRRARCGDRESTAALYLRLLPALHPWIRLRLGSSAGRSLDADDIIQEIWVRLLDILPRYDARVCGFRAWVFQVAKNVLLEQLRAVRRGSPPSRRIENGSNEIDSVAGQITTASRRIARSETVGRFVSRAAALEPDKRQLLIHCGLEGMSLAQAALRLGISRDAAAKRWQRLKRRVREWSICDEMID